MKADVCEMLARGAGAQSTEERRRVCVCLLTGHAGSQALLPELACFLTAFAFLELCRVQKQWRTSSPY